MNQLSHVKQGLKARLFISPGHRPGEKRIEKVALKVQHNLQFCTFSAVLNGTDNTQGDALGYREDGLSALRLLAKLRDCLDFPNSPLERGLRGV